jgi:hypothetical protein
VRADELIKLMFPGGGMTVQARAPQQSSDEGGGMPSLSDGISQAGAAIGAGLQKRGEDNAAMTDDHSRATGAHGSDCTAGRSFGKQWRRSRRSTVDARRDEQPLPQSAPPQYDMMQRYEDPLRKKKPYETSLFGA